VTQSRAHISGIRCFFLSFSGVSECKETLGKNKKKREDFGSTTMFEKWASRRKMLFKRTVKLVFMPRLGGKGLAVSAQGH
jgi:hypothetical protein